jgi:hypothetical protein
MQKSGLRDPGQSIRHSMSMSMSSEVSRQKYCSPAMPRDWRKVFPASRDDLFLPAHNFYKTVFDSIGGARAGGF